MDSPFLTLISGLRRFTSRVSKSACDSEYAYTMHIHYIATLNGVTISRDGECARIKYKEDDIPETHLEIGPEIAGIISNWDVSTPVWGELMMREVSSRKV
jgi:hypothetical protein